MKDEILVSIITPSYNQGEFIERTIQSVLEQTYRNIEYILIDGGSNDNTMEIVEKYRNQIDIIVHEKDQGQSDAINKGFKLAKGKLVGWINSDDVLYSDCVEKIVDLFNAHKDGSIYYGELLDHIDRSGHVLQSVRTIIPDRNHLLNISYDVVQPGSFYSLDFVQKVNYLNEGIHYAMDLDLWLRLLRFGPIYSYKDKAIATIRKWEATKTTTGGIKFFEDIRRVLLKEGGKASSQNMSKLRYYIFKQRVKRIISR